VTPENPLLVDQLAAEYVLGTLRGPARRRFERWRISSPLVAQRCLFWEEHLIPLARELRPIQPPPHLWQSIRRRLNLTPPRSRTRPAYALAIAASVLMVVILGVVVYWSTTRPGTLSEVATISAPAGAAAWRVEIYAERGQMIVHAGQLPPHPANRDFELWALPTGGSPVSLGVLPVGGTARRELSEAQRQALSHATQIAVTVEPTGGSPTGQPTSTPIFVVPLRAVS
jgi:anti-sigma-K factor RskA